MALERTERAESSWPRRKVLALLSAMGTGAVFSRALVSLAQEQPAVSLEMIQQAEWVAGQTYTDAERQLMQDGVNRLIGQFDAIRAVEIDNATPPALHFRPTLSSPGRPTRRGRATPTGRPGPVRPESDEDLAFAGIGTLGRWLRGGQISSTELTRFCLDRLQRFDPQLECVITLLEERALQRAAQADREFAQGRDRGPLHGIPWGAKDLLAVPGAPTTWGAEPFREQVRPETATVVRYLDEAGAVLTAKLTLGALAWGDHWFGGQTRNPWNPQQGSSGSSAGSAAAVSAGLVPFAIGSETLGSIVSPCTRCGVTGFRPTFGRVSRYGAMALSWSMDKLGPIARSAEDCALVFDAIHGRDGRDPVAVDGPFQWPAEVAPQRLKVGYVAALFDEDRSADVPVEAVRKRVAEWQEFDRRTLQTLRDAGLQLSPIALPDDLPVGSLQFILTAEAAAAFDDLTRSGRDDALKRQIANAWPNVFRQAQLIPAVEYLRANRLRTRLIESLDRSLSELDAYVVPSYGGDHLLMTNLTGHPGVCVPNGFHTVGDRTPTSITFGGKLFGDGAMLAAAHAFQQATDFHRQRPPIGPTGDAKPAGR